MEKLLDSLNPAQREAVLHSEGPLLIIAGAGAGKTKTLTHRIAHLMTEGVKGENILAITFTNKAAQEMQDRALSLIKESGIQHSSAPLLLTFHSLGVRILRSHGEKLGIPRTFTILDRDDSKKLVKESLVEASLDPQEWNPGIILSKISEWKSRGLSPNELEHEGGAFIEIAADVWKRYERRKKDSNALDFDDLLLKPVELLRANKELRTYFSDRFRYLHIDEYQDTNDVQYRLAELFTATHDNLCVVGDADQTIYTWRGANIQNILRFQKDFPRAKVVLLEKNYRSTATILEAANEAIRHNTLRIEKKLVTDNEQGDPIECIVSWNENEEARTIASRISNLLHEGIEPQEIGILYRTNFQSRAIEEALLQERIPYTLLGTRFFERKEIKDLLSYLRLVQNERSDLDLVRVVNTPKRGIGKQSLQKILAGYELGGKAGREYDAFKKLIENARDLLQKETLGTVLQELFIKSGLKTFLEGSEDSEDRLLNIQELIAISRQYDNLPGPEAALKLLEESALATDQDDLKEGTEGVRLLTVHASKGLEFDTVFVTGLEEGLFPLERDTASLEEKEEERRLFYVAITRAKKRLILSRALERSVFGSKMMRNPSSFLASIPEHLCKKEVESAPQMPRGGLLDDYLEAIEW